VVFSRPEFSQISSHTCKKRSFETGLDRQRSHEPIVVAFANVLVEFPCLGKLHGALEHLQRVRLEDQLMVLSFLQDLQAKKRFDERTRTADLISLRIRFGPLYLCRKVAYIRRIGFAAYRRVTLDYAQVSVPVSVS